MPQIMLTWLVVWLALAGLGLGLRRIVGVRDGIGHEATTLVWSGYAIALLALQLWHLFLPVGATIGVGLLVAGLALFATLGRSLAAQAVAAARRHPVAAAIFVLLVTWTANRALAPALAHDSGLYHFAVIQWNSRFAVVPGLGNLSPTFAHNSAHLLLAAALDVGPWEGRVEHVLTGSLVFAMLIMAASGLGRYRSAATRFLGVYDALALVPIAMVVLSREISSPKTDAAPAFLVLVMMRQLLQLLAEPEANERVRAWRVVELAILGAAAVTVKLSTAPFVVGLLLVLLVRQFRAADPGRWRSRAAVWSIAAVVALLLPWCVRGTIMSGYPLYPSRVIGVPVDWRMPVERIELYTEPIADFGRRRLPELAYWALEKVGDVPDTLKLPIPDEARGLNWVAPWLITLPAHSPVTLCLPIIILAAAVVTIAVRRRRVETLPSVGLAVVPLVLALVFWFLTAPDPRFAYGLAWSAAGFGVAYGLRTRWEAGAPATRVVPAAVLIVGGAAVLGRGWMEMKVRGAEHPWRELLVRAHGPDHGFHPRPVVELQSWVSEEGVTVRRPVEGTLVWDAEQPAVGWPDPPLHLRHREPGVTARGYRIDRTGDSPPDGG